jgi:hypothetical protein
MQCDLKYIYMLVLSLLVRKKKHSIYTHVTIEMRAYEKTNVNS